MESSRIGEGQRHILQGMAVLQLHALPVVSGGLQSFKVNCNLLKWWKEWNSTTSFDHLGLLINCCEWHAVVEVLENMVFLSNATNFVQYFLNSMHYSAADSANMVTNFMGTSFLLTIFGGFISDSFLTRFKTFIIFCTLELLVNINILALLCFICPLPLLLQCFICFWCFWPFRDSSCWQFKHKTVGCCQP